MEIILERIIRRLIVKQKLNKPSETKEFINNYYKIFPKLRQFIANQVTIAIEQGFTKTILSEYRYLT